MKKKYLFIILFALMFLPFKVNASGSFSLSASSITMYPGESRTITISSSDSVGRLNISSSNGGVVSVSAGSVFIDTVGASKQFTITSGSVGSATVSVVGTENYASYSDMVSLNGMVRTITINVINKPAPAPSNPTPAPAPSGPADTRSTNTGLSKLTVNGKSLSNVNNVFTLEVSNYVDKANIDAVVADSKAKVTGTGSKDLKVGENNFSVVVTAERGNSTTYTVKVIRKEANVFSDLDELLNQSVNDITVQIGDSDKLTKEQIDKIISSKKKVTLTKVDENKKVLYSFILDGNTIKSSNEFNPNIVLVIEDNSDMEEAINYADGIYLDFSKCGDIPKGTLLKYFVGDKYKDNDKVNLYSYDGDKIIQLKDGITVVDGYIEFNVDDSIRHLISKAKVLNAEVKKEEMDIWFIVSIVLAVVSVLLFILFVSSRCPKGSKKETKSVDKVEVIEPELVKVEEVSPASDEVLEKLDDKVVETAEEPVIVSEVTEVKTEEKVEEL